MDEIRPSAERDKLRSALRARCREDTVLNDLLAYGTYVPPAKIAAAAKRCRDTGFEDLAQFLETCTC